jgi:hypothetical protein
MYRRNPIRQILIPLPRNQKPSLPNHPAKLLLTRELRNTLHQILVTRSIPRDHLPNHRDRVERPLLVDSVKERVLDLAELETREDAAGLEHAEGFFQGDVLVREIADAERDGVQVDGVVWDHVQLLSVGLYEPQPGTPCVGCLQAALLALGQHLRVDVCDGDVGVCVVVDVRGVVEHAEGDVARAAGDVEDVPALLLVRGGGGERVAARVEVAHEVVFPQAVDAEGHEVVHVVVAGCYRGEDAADWGRVISLGYNVQIWSSVLTSLLLQRLGDRLESKVCRPILRILRRRGRWLLNTPRCRDRKGPDRLAPYPRPRPEQLAPYVNP